MSRFAPLYLIACLFTAPPSLAQFGGNDSNILIESEKATYQGPVTILENNVHIRQNNAQIFSDIMHIYRAQSAPDGNGTSGPLGTVERIEAEGNFRYVTPENTVTGEKGVYERATGIITITGNVKVVQTSGNVVTTDKLIYNVKTETIRFQGNCLGATCTNRPTIRIQ